MGQVASLLKTALLLGALTGLIVAVGGYFGGEQGMILAFAFAAVMNFGAYWFSDKIVLRTSCPRRRRTPSPPVATRSTPRWR